MSTKAIAAALAVTLLTVGGAAAVTTTGEVAVDDRPASASGQAHVDATHENGTVTVSVTRDGSPVENASVEVGDLEFTTDNGTVVVENVSVDDELTVEVEADGFEGEVVYELADGDLTIQKEEFEYETDHDEAEERDDDAGDEHESVEAEANEEDADEEHDDEDEERESEASDERENEDVDHDQ